VNRVRAWLAGGQPLGGEVFAARDSLSRAQRRAAGRAVRRGEAVEDPVAAGLAVAMARMTSAVYLPRWLVACSALIVVAWAWLAVDGLVHGHVATAAGYGCATVFGLWALHTQRRRRLRAAREAERLNREVLLRAGESDDLRVPAQERSILAAAVGGAVLWLVYDLTYGAMTELLDGRSLEVGRVVGGGALFATVMLVFNLILMRRYARRQPS
jgi:hypothetical protein